MKEHCPMPFLKKNKLYALSTCVWCKEKTKRLLDKLGGQIRGDFTLTCFPETRKERQFRKCAAGTATRPIPARHQQQKGHLRIRRGKNHPGIRMNKDPDSTQPSGIDALYARLDKEPRNPATTSIPTRNFTRDLVEGLLINGTPLWLLELPRAAAQPATAKRTSISSARANYRDADVNEYVRLLLRPFTRVRMP